MSRANLKNVPRANLFKNGPISGTQYRRVTSYTSYESHLLRVALVTSRTYYEAGHVLPIVTYKGVIELRRSCYTVLRDLQSYEGVITKELPLPWQRQPPTPPHTLR